MPFEINEEAFRKATEINLGNPQEVVVDPLPANWSGTKLRGLPVRQIPFLEFPRVVYMHPNEPFRTVEHRNADQELVHREQVATEHLSKTVATEEELKAALEEGWVKEPYIPTPPPKKDVGLYGKPKTKQEQGKK